MRMFAIIVILAAEFLIAPCFAETTSPAHASVATEVSAPGRGFGAIMLDLTPPPAVLALLAVAAELLFVWRFRAADVPA